jgi:hypothetical protein
MLSIPNDYWLPCITEAHPDLELQTQPYVYSAEHTGDGVASQHTTELKKHALHVGPYYTAPHLP